MSNQEEFDQIDLAFVTSAISDAIQVQADSDKGGPTIVEKDHHLGHIVVQWSAFEGEYVIDVAKKRKWR